MKLLISAAVLLSVSTASAAPEPTPEPRIELVERGDAVEIIARNVKASSTAIKAVRSRLEVEVAGRPRTRPLVPAGGHKTLVIAELDGDGPRTSLSVKLAFNYQDVKTVSRFAQASQVGDDLHLMFPRTVPAEGATVVLPEPTLPPELAAKLAAPKAEPKAEPKPEPKPTAPMPSVRAESAVAATTTPSTTPAPSTTAPAPTKLDLPKDSGGSSWQLYALCGVAAIGAGVWLLKKKKPAQPATSIEVIAQRALGGKAKMVWVSVGEREMVVAVTQQQVRMLGQWPKGQNPQHANGPTTYSSFAPSDLPTAQVVERPMSDPAKSSVAGLMKLRARTASQSVSQMSEDQAASILSRARTSSRVFQRPQVSEDVATGDDIADEMWAREIVAATGARR